MDDAGWSSPDALLRGRYSRDHVRIVRDSPGFRGFFTLAVLQLSHRLFGGGWSQTIERELFVKTEAAAAIVYDPALDAVGLVEQFRAGALDSEFGPWCLEVVAGMMEPGESAEALIRRELQEEAGLNPYALHKITAYYSTPGACNEKIHLYCALCDLSQAGGVHGLADEHEDIYLHRFRAEDVLAAMLNSRVNNAATLLGLQWLALHRSQLRAGGASPQL